MRVAILVLVAAAVVLSMKVEVAAASAALDVLAVELEDAIMEKSLRMKKAGVVDIGEEDEAASMNIVAA